MRKFTSLLSMLLLFTAFAFSQAKTVTGRVTDEQGQAVPFASIKIQGAKTGASADADGNFTIKANEGATLVITAQGRKEQQIKVGAANSYSVSLSNSSTTQIQDVVITTVLGQVRQAKELGYSTAKVRAAELTQAKPVSVSAGLVGKVSGLNVTTINNSVFADTRITLRGIRSLNSGDNQPMVLLDGVGIAL
ncbi:MAG: carboxypeptidase-like regulatory domain-containing protein, partial [Bacteroidota bacterium]